VGGLDKLVLLAHGKRLGVAQSHLEFTCQFIHAHSVYPRLPTESADGKSGQLMGPGGAHFKHFGVGACHGRVIPSVTHPRLNTNVAIRPHSPSRRYEKKASGSANVQRPPP